MLRRKTVLLAIVTAVLAVGAGSTIAAVAATGLWPGGGSGSAVAAEQEQSSVTAAGDDKGTPAAQEQEKSDKGWLGITLVDVAGRVIITSVMEGSPAAQAGLVKGDIIVSVAGTAVSDVEEVHDQLASRSAGDQVILKVLRKDGSSADVTVTLGERPQPAGTAALRGIMDALRNVDLTRLAENFVRTETVYLDAAGNQVRVEVTAGTVASASNTNVTVNLNGGGQETYAVASDTTVIKDGLIVEASRLEAGDRVFVVTVNDRTQVITTGNFPFTPLLPHLPSSLHFDFDKAGPGRIYGCSPGHIVLREHLQGILEDGDLRIRSLIPGTVWQCPQDELGSSTE